MSNKNKQAQRTSIENSLGEMLEWYVENSGGKIPTLAEDAKTYRGIVRRWYEPLIPGVENPCLVEEALGDYWTLRMEPVVQNLIT